MNLKNQTDCNRKKLRKSKKKKKTRKEKGRDYR